MKYEVPLLALAGLATARDVESFLRLLGKREVPQEHAHEDIIRATTKALKLNDPLSIGDAVFGLLGAKASLENVPTVKDTDCLQQITADQAFTNAKAAGDIDGQVNAILYRALEKNTGSVGLASVACTQKAVNPEIAALQQHQDPASSVAAGNKDIELAVAAQLAAIGADPLLALQTGTFPPGKIGDPTAAGLTCDDANDAAGCINTLNLLTPLATADDIKAAVASSSGAAGKAGAAADKAGEASACAAGQAASKDASKGAAKDAAASDKGAAGASTAATGTVNVQAFTGDLGGPPPPVASTAGAERPFDVNGSTFLNIGAAVQRSCAVQKNACANAANSGALDGGSQQCDAQEKDCLAANSLKRKREANRARRSEYAVRAALDTGSCGSPALQFADGLDGRKEASFQTLNNKDFAHGSALNIKVVADFTCDRLASNCKASEDTVATCRAASAAASKLTGQAAADSFNKALGVA